MSPPQKRRTVDKAKRPAGVPEIALLSAPKNVANATYLPFASPMPVEVKKLLERGTGVGTTSTSLMDGGMLHASARSASSHSTSPATSTTSSPSGSPTGAPTGHSTKKTKAKRSGSPTKKKKAAAAGARPTKSPPGSANKHGKASKSTSPTTGAAAGKATKATGVQRPVTNNNLGRGVSPARPGATPAKKRAAAAAPKKPARSPEESEVSDFAAAAAAHVVSSVNHQHEHEESTPGVASEETAAAPASPRKRSAPRPAAADAFQRLSGTNGTQDETLALLLGLTGMRPQQRSNELASPNRFLAQGNGQRRAVCV